jgi:hypothetical protein
MEADLTKKLAELKTKRHAIEQAIAALQNLEIEYRERRDRPRDIPNRRSMHLLKSIPSRRIA